MTAIPFEEYLESIQALGGIAEISPDQRAEIEAAAEAIKGIPNLTVEALADLLASNPDWASILGMSVGLSQEQLKNLVRHRTGKSLSKRLAREEPQKIIEILENELGLVERLTADRERSWTFADVLVERVSSRVRAGGAISRGRGLEDQVEVIVRELGLPHAMRTRFTGKGGSTAPCDLAIPGGEKSAKIVCGIKGFDSTGSKLTDAVREVEQMAEVRLPKQFVCAVVDGMGWLSRQADLRRIHALWENDLIDGLYTLTRLPVFREDIAQAARILGISR